MSTDALMQPESRDAWFRMLGDGWTDAIRSRHPAGGVWTFWDYQRAAGNATMASASTTCF
jgi:exodeoxyribonuclease-3